METQTLTCLVKLYPDKEQRTQLIVSMKEYIETVNRLVKMALNGVDIKKFTSKDVKADLPGSLRCQCAQDARSIVKKHNSGIKRVELKNKWRAEHGKKLLKIPKTPELKSLIYSVNNQSYSIEPDGCIRFNVTNCGKRQKLNVLTGLTEKQIKSIKAIRPGQLKIVKKRKSLYAVIGYKAALPEGTSGENVMGIDLGLKCPAVAYVSTGKVRFFGNGRQNRFIRTRFQTMRDKCQKEGKRKLLRKMCDKEGRIMNDIDHKISREIIDFAKENEVGTIKLENISNMNDAVKRHWVKSARKYLTGWSFARLGKYIEYKAKLAGIEVRYVNPSYTSQQCPKCGKHNKTEDRNYVCECGYHGHRDLVGAYNICNGEPIKSK